MSAYATVKTLRGFLRGWTGYDSEEGVIDECKTAPTLGGTVRALPGKSQAAGTSKGYPASADAVKISSSTGSSDEVELDARCLFCAGKARDSHSPDSQQEYPLLVVSACYLPSSPTEHHVRQLFQRLDELTSEPYLMVLFATPSPTFSVKQLVAYYRALSNGARRNVKRLYICHPGLLTRLAVKLFLNTIVSGKVAQKGKVKVVPTLSFLAREVDLAKISIPPAVLIYNHTLETKIILPENQKRTAVFGLACKTVLHDESTLPTILQDCLDHIRKNTRTPGIFRRVPKVAHLELVKEAYERGQPVQLEEWPDSAILASSLLKTYVRNLLYPVIPAVFYEDIRKAPLDETACCGWIKESFLPQMEASHPDGKSILRLLHMILQLLHEISKQSDINKMDSGNLAIVMAAVFVRSDNAKDDAAMCRASATTSNSAEHTQTLAGILKVAIENYDEIFPTPVEAQSGSPIERHSPKLDGHAKHSPTNKASRATVRLLSGSPTAPRPKATRAPASRETVMGLFANSDQN